MWLTLRMWTAAVFSVMLAASSVAADPPLIRNGSFELRDGDSPRGWKLPADPDLAEQWSLDPSKSVDGRFSLKIERAGPARRGFVVQRIDVEAGETYILKAFVRGDGLRGAGGEDVGAGVFVEFFREGEYLRGQYPGTKSGSLDWIHVEHGFTVPATADHVNVGLYLRPDTVGEAWFDDVHVEPVRGDLVTGGGFESWTKKKPADWVASRGRVRRDSLGWRGDAAAMLSAGASMSQQIRLRAERWYLASFRARGGARANGLAKLRIAVDGGVAGREGPIDVAMPVSQAWQRYRAMWRSGSVNGEAALRLVAVGGGVVLDDVAVREVPRPIATVAPLAGPGAGIVVDLPYGLSGAIEFESPVRFTVDQPRPIVVPLEELASEDRKAHRIRIDLDGATVERQLLRSPAAHRKLRKAMQSRPSWSRVDQPLGIYSSELDRGEIEGLKELGFTHVLPYAYGVQRSTDPARFLSDAESAELGVIYSLKDLLPASNWYPKGPADHEGLVEHWLDRVGGHPAVASWYTADEPKPAHFEQVERLNHRIAEHAPPRPIYTVVSAPQLGATELEQQRHLRRLAEMSDVIGVDPYPVPRKPLNYAINEIRMAVEASPGDTRVWAVTQLHGWGVYGHRDESGNYLREPTSKEKRLMAIAAIATGADGLVLYAYQDLFKTGGGRRAPADVIERRLDELDRLAPELAEIMGSLRAERAPDALHQADVEIVHHSSAPVRMLDAQSGRLRLVFANLDSEPRQAVVLAPGSRWRLRGASPKSLGVSGESGRGEVRLTLAPQTAGVLVLERDGD